MTEGQLIIVLATVLVGVALIAVPFASAPAAPGTTAADPGPTVLELLEATTSTPGGSVTRTRRVRLLAEPASDAGLSLLDPGFFDAALPDPRTTAGAGRVVRPLP